MTASAAVKVKPTCAQFDKDSEYDHQNFCEVYMCCQDPAPMSQLCLICIADRPVAIGHLKRGSKACHC